eukprot:1478348-Prorocentrum_lima.AAC.1
MASELSVLEGTVPNNKEMQNMERKTIEVYRALVNLKTELDANKRGLEYVISQVDPLEQNLEVNVPTQPTPLPP